MFHRILVPLDGSARAAQAIPVAARIARSEGGSLVLLSAIPRLDDWGWQESPPLSPEAQAEEQEKVAAELTALVSSSLLEGIDIVQEVVQGSPAATILASAQLQQIDLVVMCSHGRTGMKRWALGSVAQKVARHSSVPVLILRDGESSFFNERPQIRPARVLIALDGSPLAESVIQPAIELSAALSVPFPGALHLVRVLPFSNDFDYGQEDAVAKARRHDAQGARAYLRDLQKRLLGENPDLYIMTSLAMSMDIAETLLTIAETGEGEGMSAITSTSDVIALATHGRSGPARWVMGSVTERILGATRLPLLIVRPPQASAPELHREASAQHRREDL